MVRGFGACPTILATCALSLCLCAPGIAGAQQEYDYTFSFVLGEQEYRLYTMFLSEGTELAVSILTTGGFVDVYLLNATGASLFLSAVTTGSTSATWPYLPEMSEIHTSFFSGINTIEKESVYSVVLLNNQTAPVTISGSIQTIYHEPAPPIDWTLVIVLLGVGALAAILVIVLVLIPRTYRLQAELDSNSRTPLVDELESPAPRVGFGGKCPFCGFKNPQGSMFCASCGERIE